LNNETYIQAFSHIKQKKVLLNGKIIFQDNSLTFPDFMKEAYRSLDIKYAKFFKMDLLSKLAFMAADIILKSEIENSEKEQDIAIVFCNRASSLDTDRKHQKSIDHTDNYFPSPAVFVYTLPNICIGEISIKHKLFSENSFFIFDHFEADHLLDYTNSLLGTNKADRVLCGWVDYEDENYEAFLYLVGNKGPISHNKEEIARLYTL